MLPPAILADIVVTSMAVDHFSIVILKLAPAACYKLHCNQNRLIVNHRISSCLLILYIPFAHSANEILCLFLRLEFHIAARARYAMLGYLPQIPPTSIRDVHIEA